VTLQWQDGQVIVSWNDPSGGRAQPILVGGRQSEAPRRMGVPARGATHMIVGSLNQAYTYCFQVVLAYTDDDLRESDLVCIEGPEGSR
jgi:hypothetical protein